MTLPRNLHARPRTAEEIATLRDNPEILKAVSDRNITQVVHFTTLSGAVGILASRAIKSRTKLPKDMHLRYVYQPNARTRKDQAWLDYVNLSVERINAWMFDHSTEWHADEDNPWVVFSFHPQILAHPGVVFTTTNNIYPACSRGEGLGGFDAMFAETVIGRFDSVHDRIGTPENWTTERQAEVLYPGMLSCEYLQRIDVQLEESLDRVYGILGGLDLDFDVSHAPEVFR